jgi:hypothetical protein
MPAFSVLRCLILCVLLLAFAGCGSATFTYENGQSNSAKIWQSWDPLAEPITVAGLEQGLAHNSGTTLGGYQVIALDELNRPALQVQQALELRQVDGRLELWATRALPWVALYVKYDAQSEHPVELNADRRGALSLAAVEQPGLVAIGVVGIREQLLDPDLPLAMLRFAPGAGSALAKRASIGQDSRNKVKDLSAVNNGDGSATLQWSERNTGDYDLNGLVGIPDMVRIGQYFNRQFTPADTDWAQLEVVDGDNDSRIYLGDLVPLSINLGSRIMGYNVYRTPLTAPDEVPSVTDAARWTKVLNTGEPAGPSAPRSYSGEKTRLVYTFIDDSGEGDFGWYVAAAGQATDVHPEGPKSDPATLTVVKLPEAGLSFEIIPPAGSTVNANDEFYVAVKVAGVSGLFSANVRFEYDTTLVQYMEGVASYTDLDSILHSNFLVPPLFVEHDYGVTGGGNYSLIGFNATEESGEPGKDGDGYLGYFKFKALAAGTNAECFRFPQVSTYIYLWGLQYGVPIATPSLGAAQNLTVQ